MKANTLYKYGKKVEIAEEMYKQKLALLNRLRAMVVRVECSTVINSGLCRKKRQNILAERLKNKLRRTEKTVAKLEELKDKYVKEFKFQREACGLTDHSFLDEFYKNC